MYGATAGQVGMLAAPMAMNQAVLSLVADERRVTPEYLFHVVRASAPALKSLATGAAQPNLSKAVILRHAIPVPALRVQEVTTRALDSLWQVSAAASREVKSLRALRSELLATVLAGGHLISKSYDDMMGS